MRDKRPLFAVALLLVVIAALSVLGINYSLSSRSERQQVSPTPTARVAERADLSTPQRSGGLTGPPLATNTATASVPTPSPSTQPGLSPAEQSLLALDEEQ